MMERLPTGFRFFPTDEELITCYLARKAADASFTSAAIRDVDLYNFDPWDLPCQQLQASAARGDPHQQECCYFFCSRSSKYSTGLRVRRATRSGYWKSTGKDKDVYSSAGGSLVGTKKTLVFHGGRAPSGKKTGWVMHEYALGESAFLSGPQREWVICRVLMKKDPSSDGKLEAEETVHNQQPPSGSDHLLPMELYPGEGEQDSAPSVYSHHANSQSGVHAMDGDEKDRPHVHEEVLMTNNSIDSSDTSPPPWLIHNDHLIHDDHQGTNCSALQFMQMQSDDADYSLPELLKYDGSYDDHLLKRSGESQDINGVDGCADLFTTLVDHSVSLHAPYWNYGS